MSPAADDLFAPPPFNPDAALTKIRSQLREWRELREISGAQKWSYELQGQVVLELERRPDGLVARLAKRPVYPPDWHVFALANHADVRKCVDEVRRRLHVWSDE